MPQSDMRRPGGGGDAEGVVVKLQLSGHAAWVSCVAWSPTSQYALASGGYDATVRIWDTRATAPLFSVAAHEDKVGRPVDETRARLPAARPRWLTRPRRLRAGGAGHPRCSRWTGQSATCYPAAPTSSSRSTKRPQHRKRPRRCVLFSLAVVAPPPRHGPQACRTLYIYLSHRPPPPPPPP